MRPGILSPVYRLLHMDGVLNLLKPPGMTSHDVVAVVRRAAGLRRVGHTGTLDPAAAGVLPVCLGQATRLVELLQAGRKEYLAELTFGYETDTLDATGQIVHEAAAGGVALEQVQGALDAFRGSLQQTPPLYSAIKRDGKKLYDLARAGVAADEAVIESRPVTIYSLSIVRFVPVDGLTPPRALLRVECGGGTYIRSLVRDIGRTVGCGATMTFLVRTRSGRFTLERAVTLEQVVAGAAGHLQPLLEALSWCVQATVVDDEAVEHLAHGRVLTAVQSEPAVRARDDAMRAHPPPAQDRDDSGPGAGEGHRVLFLHTRGAVAALAGPVPAAEPLCYKAEKVFHLEGLPV